MHIKLFLILLGILTCTGFAAKSKKSSLRLSSSAAAVSSSSLTLEEKIIQATAQAFPEARIGLVVRSTKTDSILHQIAADSWFTPASTLKTLVSATVVDTMPPDWMPETRLALDGVRSGHSFIGVVRIVGGGDPNISSRYLESALSLPLAMADSLHARGIDTIRGSIIADTSTFQGIRRPQGWRNYFFDTWYGAEVSALSFNDNVYLLKVLPGEHKGDSARVVITPDVGYIQVINQATSKPNKAVAITYKLDPLVNTLTITGSVGLKSPGLSVVLPVRNPAGYFLAALNTALAKRHITVIEAPQIQPGLTDVQFRFHTAPLQSILAEVNQRSQNLHAELMLRNLGAYVLHAGTTEGGILVEQAFLRKMGISPEDFHLVDGCGLSPDNRIKPLATSLLLSRMTRHPRARLYIESFAQPGITGTSARRLSDLEMANHVRFKTGYITGVQGLVGYIGSEKGDSVAVTLYLNDYKGDDNKAHLLVDSIWTWIAHEYNQEFVSIKEARGLWRAGDTIQGLQARLDFFSKQLMGRPYFLGPTGEGAAAEIDPKPMMDLSRFDCVTYLEHVMALAKSPGEDSVFATLQHLRYIQGQVGFSTRKHYFVEDWIGKSPDWVGLAHMPGDTTIVREMDKKAFFAAKGIVYPDSNPKTSIPYLPTAKVLLLAQRWNGPDTLMGIGFMSKLPNICVFHTGFLIAKHGQPLRFRHASQLKGETTEQDLGEYLEAKKAKIPGLVFFEFR